MPPKAVHHQGVQLLPSSYRREKRPEREAWAHSAKEAERQSVGGDPDETGGEDPDGRKQSDGRFRSGRARCA